MKITKLGKTQLIECTTREEAIAYAEAKESYRQLWMMILAAEANGLLSPN